MQRRITLALIAAALSGAPGALAQDSAPANEQKAPAQDAPASTPPAADAPAPELPDVEIQQKAEEPAQQVQWYEIFKNMPAVKDAWAAELRPL